MAANENAIENLLANPRVVIPGRVCDTCGWLSLDDAVCPVDNRATRPAADVIDEIVARVVATHGGIRRVWTDGALDDDAVAALLRFPVARPT
jgi:hypothetical protein